MNTAQRRKILVIIVVFPLVVILGIVVCGSIFLSYLPDLYCDTVHRVVAHDGNAFLLTGDLESNYRAYASEDMGDTWIRAEALSDEIQNSLRYPNPNPIPLEICDPTRLEHCYRIASASNDLEESIDTGQSWNQLEIPLRLKSKQGCQEPKPTSMVFVTNSNQSVLIVGMGTGGVITRSTDENWSYNTIDDLIQILPSD